MTTPELTRKEIEILVRALNASWFPGEDERIAFDLRDKLKKLLNSNEQ